MAFALLILLGLVLPLALGDDGGDSASGSEEPAEDRADPQADGVDMSETVSELRADADAPPLDSYRSEGAYNVDVQFEGDWTRAQQQAAIDAADYISEIVLQGLPAEDGVDDLAVTVRLIDVDGRFGIAGFGGPEDLRADGGLPYRGLIELDRADAIPSDPAYDDTMLHEMLHAMGLGTIWDPNGLVRTDDAGDPRYTGRNGMDAYAQAFPDAFAADPRADQGVPLSPDGRHWDEDVFGDEILTPNVTSGQSEPVSPLTIAALEDLGYDTVYDDSRNPADRSGRFTPLA